ncbi:hypothetical protein [Streptomyces griseus]|uniref:hypothetical protein n=1 Tax=Streptomyces griseus TaxID=1911 RepID=UPI00055E58C4|nr:hypothetical protein [Streptomyces griseus]
MRTGPLADALIEHLIGDLGRYALENSFHIVVDGTVLAQAHPRARGGAARPGHQGRGAEPLASAPGAGECVDELLAAHIARGSSWSGP